MKRNGVPQTNNKAKQDVLFHQSLSPKFEHLLPISQLPYNDLIKKKKKIPTKNKDTSADR
jgi:hypothetical protein